MSEAATQEHVVSGGFLLAVEGVDGAGKSTVLQALEQFCRDESWAWVRSREPTDGPYGKRLRESAQSGRGSLAEELEWFLADRREHVEGLIAPALAQGRVVLLDRYYFSNAAYQGARGADPTEVLRRNELFAPPPDLVLLLDCPAEVSLERIRRRGSVPDEFERREALEAVRSIFCSIRRPFIRVVRAEAPESVVARECVAHLRAALAQKRTENRWAKD
jgi:dTMP kinase